MKKNHLISAMLAGLIMSFYGVTQAQSVLKSAIIINGGMFEFAPPFTDYVSVSAFDPVTKTVVEVDTIYTQSVQDALLVGNDLYVAAGDSIVRYDASTLSRLASARFGAPSTIKMEVFHNQLIVGNWFGSPDNNLRVFDKSSLVLLDSIPEVQFGAKDFVLVGDSLYVQQNLNSSSFTDSAGFLAVIHLASMEYVREIHYPNNDEELGRLVVHENTIYGFNSASNTVSTYDVATGVASTSSIIDDLELGPYGPQYAEFQDTLYLKMNGGIGSFDLNTGQVIQSLIVDTLITAFSLDTVNRHFYVTQTDFASFTRGGIYDFQGQHLDTLPVGFSPEVLAMVYDQQTGVNESLLEAEDWSVFPNPAADVLTIVPNHNRPYDLFIYRLDGKMIFQQPALAGTYMLPVESYEPGLYLIMVNDEYGPKTKRFIKK